MAVPASVQSDQLPTSRINGEIKETDPRLQRIRSFFGSKDAPAEGYAAEFVAAADRHNLDWRLLPSISFVESTGGKFSRNNNILGWGSRKPQRFTSIQHGIDEVARILGQSKLYKDKGTDGILQLYNPYSHYTRVVKAVMESIGPADLGPASRMN